MKYTAPEITILGNADDIIQDFTKAHPISFDPLLPTIRLAIEPAYDLDE